MSIELKHLNKQISDALNEACDKRNLSESSKKKIFDFIDITAIGGSGESDNQIRVESIIKAISNKGVI